MREEIGERRKERGEERVEPAGSKKRKTPAK